MEEFEMHHKSISDFIYAQWADLDNRDSNFLGTVFGEVQKYYEYLSIIMNRYAIQSEKYIALSKLRADRMSKLEGSRRITEEEARQIETLRSEGTILKLEIENLYLYTNILLDRLASATQFFFGKRKKEWKSFDSMYRYIEEYCANRGISKPSELMLESMQWLRENVRGIRNNLIVHKHETDEYIRRDIGLGYRLDSNEATIGTGIMYPTGTETHIDGVPGSDIIKHINILLEEWLKLLKSNTELRNIDTRLDTTKSKPGSKDA